MENIDINFTTGLRMRDNGTVCSYDIIEANTIDEFFDLINLLDNNPNIHLGGAEVIEVVYKNHYLDFIWGRIDGKWGHWMANRYED